MVASVDPVKAPAFKPSAEAEPKIRGAPRRSRRLKSARRRTRPGKSGRRA